MQPEEIQALVKRYLDGSATPAEKQLLDKWYQEGQTDPVRWFAESNHEEELLRLEMLENIKQRAGLAKQKLPKRLWPRIAAAASILLAISAGGYFVLHKKAISPQIVQNQKRDIAPGQNKPILTLAGGQQIVLTGKTGQLAVQGNTAIRKTANGQLVYQAVAANTSAPAPYNTVTNPRGSEAIHIVLSDGTDAWLNAASSITYQTEFNGKERNIKITGEVAFRVKYIKDQPFYVTAKGQTTQDLGTTFDIKAYDDEAVIKTSLLEGSIKVIKNGQSITLKPGQQALAGSIIAVQDADMDEAFAWKNGYFIFNDENIQDIMQDISRWYDVDVTYQGDMKGKQFVGSVSRFKNVSEVLRKLEETGTIHFKTEGRRITVMP